MRMRSRVDVDAQVLRSLQLLVRFELQVGGGVADGDEHRDAEVVLGHASVHRLDLRVYRLSTTLL